MPELVEAADIALAKGIVDECPFAHEDQKHNKTNDFANIAATLGNRMKGGAPIKIDVKLRGHTKQMELGFQAHHLIPGTSIKGASALRSHITKGKTVKADIGYKQNDKWNGAWLPALHKFKGWGELGRTGGYEIQFAYAYAAMLKTQRQFHMGDGSHKDYNACVRRALELIRLKMVELKAECKQCEDRMKKPWDPPYQLYEMLQGLATKLNGYVTGPTNKWIPPYCTSDFAALVGYGKTPDSMAAE